MARGFAEDKQLNQTIVSRRRHQKSTTATGLVGGPITGPISRIEGGREKLLAFLEQQGFTDIKEDIHAPFSPWIGHASKDGRSWIVKLVRSDQGYKHGEVQALKVFAQTGVAAEAVALTDDGLLLAVKDLHGPSLEQSLEGADFYEQQYDSKLGELGQLAARLHTAVSDKPLLFTDILPTRYNPTDTGRPGQVTDFTNGHAVTRKLYEALTQQEENKHSPLFEDIFLHGDLNFRNIVQTEDRLVAIDPYGLQGPAYLDLAIPAAFTPDPEHAIKQMLAGYTQELGKVKEAQAKGLVNENEIALQQLLMAWACIMACEQLHERGQWTPQHQRLVNQVL